MHRSVRWIGLLALGLAAGACSEDVEVADPAGMGAGQPETGTSEPTPPLEVLENTPGGAITDSSAAATVEPEVGEGQ